MCSTQVTCVHIRYSFSSYYLNPILKWVSRTLNKFKWNSSQLQSCRYVKTYNFGFGHFFIRRRMKKLNFKCEKFKHNLSWIDDFKWESCHLQSCISLHDLQLNFDFGHFNVWGQLKKSNLLCCTYFSDGSRSCHLYKLIFRVGSRSSCLYKWICRGGCASNDMGICRVIWE
jgi:hypothetical protein